MFRLSHAIPRFAVKAAIVAETEVANRNLTEAELEEAWKVINDVRQRLVVLAGDDPLSLFAYRRKVMKELGYDDRSKPAIRNKLKAMKWEQQGCRCAECGEDMPLSYSELDRRKAAGGYTAGNTELVHAKCHHKRQAEKGYA